MKELYKLKTEEEMNSTKRFNEWIKKKSAEEFQEKKQSHNSMKLSVKQTAHKKLLKRS